MQRRSNQAYSSRAQHIHSERDDLCCQLVAFCKFKLRLRNDFLDLINSTD